jgi:hypothetical protein
LIPLPLNDDDTGKLDLVLGQTYSLLDCAGEETARDLLRTAVLTLRRDGGFFNPMPRDGWTADTYEAVLTVERLLPTCTPGAKEVIWGRAAATLYAYSLLQEDVAARVRDAFPVLGSPAGLAAEATVCARLLQTVARGDNLPLEDRLRDWSEELRRR